jgi:HSP90 family molecular chaperone
MSNQWKDVKDQFTIEDIGAPLLANLAKGIYTPEAMLREYVQNAGDAYFELEDKTHKKHRSEEKAIDIYYADERTIAIQPGRI